MRINHIIVYTVKQTMNREKLKGTNMKEIKKNMEMEMKKNMMDMRSFTTDIQNESHLLNRMYQKIDRTTHLDPHPGLIIAGHHFKDPYYPLVNEISLLSLVTMDLLIKYGYPILSGYGKFTISYTMKRSYGEEIQFTTGPAIPLTYQNCELIPTNVVYAHICRSLSKYAEIYDGDSIIRLMVRVYIDSNNDGKSEPTGIPPKATVEEVKKSAY